MKTNTIDFDLILFDMDGTLTNTMRLQPYLVWKYLVNKKISFEEVQKRMAVIYYLNKFSWFRLRTIQLFCQQFSVNYFKMIFFSPFLGFHYLRAILGQERLFPDVKKKLLELKEHGFVIGLVTNGMDFEVRIKIPSIKNLFDIKITASDVLKKKPNPEMILKAIEKAKSNPKQTLYVGDTLVDMLSSANAGCNFALMTTGTFGSSIVKIGNMKPSYVFNSITELVDLLIRTQ